MIQLTFPGQTRSKKNSRRIVRKGNGHISIPSDAYVKWHRQMIAMIKKQVPTDFETITAKVNLQCVFFSPSENFDLSNHIQSIEDTLQDVRVLDDDRQVFSYDGSSKVYICEHCNKRRVITKGPRKGQKERNCGAVKRCPYARVLVRVDDFIEDNETKYLTWELMEDENA